MRFLHRIKQAVVDRLARILRPLEKPLGMDKASLERRKARMGEAKLQRYANVGGIATVIEYISLRVFFVVGPGPWKWFLGLSAVATFLFLAGTIVILFRSGRP
ncbi:MAG: hypothetical protein QOH26_675 [Actinomycetota bacterium]|nr:hypothetical protein [Actinomycetota bacterium]